MKIYKYTVMLMLVMAAMILPVSAQAITVDPTAQFCFSAEDFMSEDDGVFLTSVPTSAAKVRYNGRVLKAGDALPREALNQLTLDTNGVSGNKLSIGYYTVSDGMVTGAKELKLSILPKKNEPPVAEDGTLETYRNIPNSGTLSASDPEDGKLTYEIETEPKRGSVEVQEDGSFTYTPSENKVGKDSFTFTVTDDAGNVSEPATVSILIKKPTDKDVYADMRGDPDAFSAMWMKEEDLLRGNLVAGNLCFEPDRPVSRGEFLVMAMKLVDAQAEDAEMTSGFADEADTPDWMRPYIVSALGNGMISGVQSEEGILFQPQAQLTRGEAAVMMQNILQLPNSTAQAVFSNEDHSLPVWAEQAAASLAAAGIHVESSADEIITRRDAANLFYQVHQWMEQDALETFYWTK